MTQWCIGIASSPLVDWYNFLCTCIETAAFLHISYYDDRSQLAVLDRSRLSSSKCQFENFFVFLAIHCMHKSKTPQFPSRALLLLCDDVAQTQHRSVPCD